MTITRLKSLASTTSESKLGAINIFVDLKDYMIFVNPALCFKF